ncbi:MAG: hypothetical protein AB7O62_01875 [Pirellulales bacterium]
MLAMTFRWTLLPCLVALSAIWPALLATPARPATRVELVIDEAMADRSVPWPVTTGVPFPQGGLTSLEHCRLVDDRGQRQLFQAKAAATWDANRSSIRWLTIDFIAHPGRKYALEFGPDVTPQAMPGGLVLQVNDTAVIVETGPLRAEFSQQGPAALAGVFVDLNADGHIGADERIARGPADGEHVFADAAGQRSTSAADGEDRQIVVESSGPVRCCLRVDGWYTAPDGGRLVRYRTRYHLFAGLPVVKVIDEFRVVGSTRDTRFVDIALPLELNLDGASRQITAGWPSADNGQASLPWNSTTQSVSLAQETFRHYGNTECRATIVETTAAGEQPRQTGEQAGTWLQVADDKAAVTGSLRWFWQQFPKEWRVTNDRLTLHLWSPRGGPLDFGEKGLRDFFGPAGHKYLLNWEGVGPAGSPIEKFFYFAGRHALERDGADGLGINKHHEAWFHFGPAAAAAAGREYGQLAEQQPLCLATGEWNCATGVFGPLAARPNDSPHEAVVDRLFDLERYAQDAFGDYGWWLFGAGPHYSYQWDKETQRHYADPRRFEYHTYQRETQLWWCYLRSGERKFHDWAIPAENHWVDVAVAHVPTKYSTEWRGGVEQPATMHYAAGDWSIDSPLHYVRHHDTGEAWLRSASQLWGSYHRTLETTTLAYYLTGDERYNDIIGLWSDYWRPLAGVRSDAADVPVWHREQVWFQPTAPGEPSQTWAEMIRDYAPFQSGSRHQMTLFFNLATLYEQTWDPALGQVAREFADAYLAPEEPNGVWQCQDHRLPAHSDSPMLAHYWSPAMWKYARATQDPRMPEVLRKYFTACYEADPYHGEVGVYSEVQIAWAWHFTRDPRHLVAAQYQLQAMQPLAAPLARPEDLGPLIYNPHNPTRALTAVPRLLGALADAERSGVAVPSQPPLTPQRALVAFRRQRGVPLSAVTWGWDKQPSWLNEQGQPIAMQADGSVQRSPRQPFDRVMPGYEAYRATVELSAAADDTWCYLSPTLETGLLELSGAAAVWCWAGEPLHLEPRRAFWWRNDGTVAELKLMSAQPGQLRVLRDGQPVAVQPVPNGLSVPLADVPAEAWLSMETPTEAGVWFQLAGVPASRCWVSSTGPVDSQAPPAELTALRVRPTVDPRQTFVPGKFRQGLLLVPGRRLRIPDELPAEDGTRTRLSQQRQGTIEFWIRRLSDERLAAQPLLTFMENGPLQAWSPWKVPLDTWSHVAVVWRPVADLPDITLVHIYVDGRDYGNYRSLYWAGYAPPPLMNTRPEWKKEFIVQAPPGTSYIIDDIRISTEPRYGDLSLLFGRQQTFNPISFTPPEQPAPFDEATVIYLPLDGDSGGMTVGQAKLAAVLELE